MPGRILVAYGSRYGGSKGVAEELSTLLGEAGYDTDLWNLRKEKRPKGPIDSYDGYIIGSGIKINKWTKEAENLLRSYGPSLGPGKPLGVFVCCGMALDSKEEARESYIVKTLEKHGVHANIIEAFGPLFDLSSDSEAGFMGKRIMRTIGKEMEKKHDLSVVDGKKNDFRDWEDVRAFAHGFIALL